MKILAVDDEQIMLEAITKILTHAPGIQLETARSGREALEKAESFHPHLIMMDIKLPGANGLETLAEIRRLLPNVVAIIISAYDNFIYAQDAIRLNVFDYLLKPVNKTRLLEIIARVAKHLENLHNVRQAEIVQRERYQKLRPLVERELLHSLQTATKPSLWENYQTMLEIEITAGFFMALVFPEPSALFGPTGEPGAQLQEKLVSLAEWLRHRFGCLIGPLQNNPVILFIPFEKNDFKAVDFAELQQSFGNRILKYIKDEPALTPVRIGVGNIRLDPAHFSLSYQEALQALRQPGEGLLYYNQASEQQANPAQENILELELHEIVEAVRFGHLARVETLLQKFTAKYSGSSGLEHEHLLTHLLELLLTSYRFCREVSQDQTHRLTIKQLLTILDTSHCLADTLSQVAATLVTLTAIIKDKRANQVRAIIIQAKALIDDLYQQDLSLEEVARAVAISPFYLSRLFREEMGLGFTEYLTRLRLEKSLTLLAQGLTVKECSFAIGYNDPNYFSRLFRKHFKVSPTEYRETTLPKKGVIAHEHSGD
jgi:two-component system response regulator YesN